LKIIKDNFLFAYIDVRLLWQEDVEFEFLLLFFILDFRAEAIFAAL